MSTEIQEADTIVKAITVEVSKMTLDPGDTLVLKVNAALSRLQRERVRRLVADYLPLRGAGCIVLDAGMELQIVSSPRN